jgi:hypothetical protein
MMLCMRKLGSSIRRGEDNPDPEWDERRRSMTRIERVVDALTAVFCVVVGPSCIYAGLKLPVDGTSKWPLAVVGTGLLAGCWYFARKAWLGKRKLPEER